MTKPLLALTLIAVLVAAYAGHAMTKAMGQVAYDLQNKIEAGY